MKFYQKFIVLLITYYLSQRPDAKKLLLFGFASLVLLFSPEASTVGTPVHEQWGRIHGIAVYDTVIVVGLALLLKLNVIDTLLLGVVVHALVGVATPVNQLLFALKT